MNSESNSRVDAALAAYHASRLSAIRGLQVINAGGAIALLAFLGQVWNSAPELRSVLANSIGAMILGLIFSLVAGLSLPSYTVNELVRHNSSSDKSLHSLHKWFHRIFAGLSLMAFISGVAYLLCRVSLSVAS